MADQPTPTFQGIPIGDDPPPRYTFIKPDAEAWMRALAGEDIDPWDEEHGEATRRALGIEEPT